MSPEKKLKVNITIAEGAGPWPSDWWGKTVEVEITTLKGPNNLSWFCEGNTVSNLSLLEEPGPRPGPVSEKIDSHPVEKLFGDRIQSLHVEFYERRKP